MPRSKLEVADIFRRHGEAWRTANTGHVSFGQLRVMSAIEACRTAVLGGHVERCEDCGWFMCGKPDREQPCRFSDGWPEECDVRFSTHDLHLSPVYQVVE